MPARASNLPRHSFRRRATDALEPADPDDTGDAADAVSGEL